MSQPPTKKSRDSGYQPTESRDDRSRSTSLPSWRQRSQHSHPSNAEPYESHQRPLQRAGQQQQQQQQQQWTSFEHPHPPAIHLVPGQPPPLLGQPSFMHHGQQQHYRPPHQFRQPQHGGQHDQRSGSTVAFDNQFPLQPLDRFKVKCTPFQQPVEIGSFSYDEKRNFVMDDSQLKYYFPPDLRKPNNLSVNYDKYISRDSDVNEHIDALLDALDCIRDREEQAQIQARDQQENSHDHPKVGRQKDGNHERPSTTKADFICYRGVITKIMCTPYTKNEPWELGATLYKGSIYIEEHVTPEKRKNALGSNDRHKLMSYWGYRFETICTISKPVSELRRVKTQKRQQNVNALVSSTAATIATNNTLEEGRSGRDTKENSGLGVGEDTRTMNEGTRQHSKPAGNSSQQSAFVDRAAGGDEEIDPEIEYQIDLDDPELTGRLDGIVNTNLQYCTVARTKLGQNSIIMGAEVDCTFEPKKPSHNPISDYIELKTSRVITSARDETNFERHKLLKFWAQSFLPGVPTIIVGFRDDDGNVVAVETFKTMEIPRLVRGKEGAWDTTICINFLDGVFHFLRKIVTIDDPEVTYTIRWAYPFQAIEVEFAGKKNAFLTERFLRHSSHPSLP